MTPPLDSTPRSLIVFNVGSSSLKYQLFAFDGTLVGEALAHGNFERHASVGGTDEPSPADSALSQALEEAEKSAPGRPVFSRRPSLSCTAGASSWPLSWLMPAKSRKSPR